ncbi:peptide/nickel transport system permease protein [Devosia enhydra]|uniref:Peptide/nickel transport system permease protein n=1 Tax=Devosia enhydra TaxID=665118 RepID=A0A1K2I2N2_9HYPH|nr:ABC transporter permease [Devosia enhydra]SFZ86020.1 peptide/nickel transport system permease protein [Devosia enhydra]
MFAYLVGRIVSAIPILLLVAVFIFSLVNLTPGDPALLLAGDNATPAQVEQIRERLHLDEPLHTRFAIWAGNALQLDLGVSIYSGQPVTRLIAQRIEPTFVLAAVTLVITVLIAVPLGVIAAWKANTLIDRLIMGFAVLGFSVPVFVIGYLLAYVFSVTLKWFPVQGYSPLADGVFETLRSVTLPAIALALVFAALIARVTRAAMLEVLNENHIRTARAKGLPVPRILIVHALKNAGVPVVTVIGIGLTTLVGGVVVTESVFNIPGIGRLTVDAITRRDYPIVQGVILFFATLLIAINILVDMSYALFDPRVKG